MGRSPRRAPHASRAGESGTESGTPTIPSSAARLAARHPLAGYGIAVVATTAVVLLRWALDPWLGGWIPYVTLYGAVAVSVWLGGWKPAVLSTLLGYAAVALFFQYPRGTLDLPSTADLIGLVAYLFSCALIIAIGNAREVALHRLRDEQDRAQRSEHFHRAIAELAADFAWTARVEADGRLVTDAVSEGFQRTLGFTLGELLAAGGWSALVYPDDRAWAEQATRRALAGETIEGEVRQVTRDGRVIWIHFITRPVRDATGRVVRLYGGSRDVTEQRETAAALARAGEEARLAAATARESARQLSAILQATPAPVYLLDTQGRLMHVNRQYEEVVGQPAAELLGKRLDEVFPPEVARAFMDNNARVLEEGRAIEFEEHAAGVHGLRTYSSVKAPMFDDSGAPVGIAGFSLDISDRKRTEAALRQGEARMRLLWEAAEVLLTAEEPDVMLQRLFERIGPHIGADAYLNYVLDESGDGLRLASCSGLTDEQAASIVHLDLGQAVCGAVARDRVPCVATFIQASDDPRVQIVKAFGLRAYACNPLLVGDELLGTLSFASRTRDAFREDELEFLQIISRYVTAAFERLRLIARLRETDTRKDEFLATLAHELRNPLAPIRNMLEVLTRFDEDADLRRQARDTMTRQVDQMVRLVDDLLDVGRITRNRLELRRERVELAMVVQQAIETCRPILAERRHDLRLALPSEPVYLDADPVRLAQVFANLLNNACKYTAPGGHITLSAERQGRDAVVCVRDDGIGIPPSALPHIFDMFTQVDRSLERAQGGLGIGLTLVRQLVEMHGGHVEASSAGQGQGSTFEVRLPALVVAPPPPPPDAVRIPTPVLTGAGPRRRILVVDDYRDSAESLAIFLRFAGHEVHLAFDGLGALEEAERVHPEVVLLDIGLPGLNGLDVCRRLREQPWGREATVFALTGWGQEEDRRRSQEAGFDGHLVKPVNYRGLAELLAGLPATRTPHGSLAVT